MLQRVGDAIQFNPELLALASHYRYEPRPVAVARGNQKGRVERAIQYIRHAFFAARDFTDIDDLNAQADAWCLGQASDRPCPDEPRSTVRLAFAHEQPLLRALPEHAYDTEECVPVSVGKTPYIRFDGNDYSVPHDLVQRRLEVRATTAQVRILNGSNVVSEHARSFDRGQQVEDPTHIQRLRDHKVEAHLHSSQDRLLRAVPGCQELLQKLGKRGANLGSAAAALLRLLDHYGAAELHIAVTEVLLSSAPHPGSVRQILEKRRDQRGLPQPVAMVLPANARGVTVRPHALSGYDGLTKKETSHD